MKRFCETTRWRKPWFYTLPPKMKLLWMWLCDNCDAAGMIEPCWPVASGEVGGTVSESDLGKHFSGKIVKMEDRFWIVGFVDFQHGKLTETCPPHRSVLKLLEKYRIHYPFVRVTDTALYKEEDKEEEKEQGSPQSRRDKGTQEELLDFCASEGLPESDALTLFQKWEGNGWTNGTKRIKDWRATIRAWREQRYLPSQKPNGQKKRTDDTYQTML